MTLRGKIANLPKRLMLIAAALVSVATAICGTYLSLTHSKVHGDWISRLGISGALLSAVAFIIAMCCRRARSGRGYASVLVLTGTALFLTLPCIAIALDIPRGHERNVRLLAELDVSLPEVEPIGFEKPSDFHRQEAVRVFASTNVERDCAKFLAEFKKWWGDGASGYGGPEFCSGRGEDSAREVEVEGREGRILVRVFTRTEDLFVF